jgi:hypothetical protein
MSGSHLVGVEAGDFIAKKTPKAAKRRRINE